MARIHTYNQDNRTNLPVYGAGVDIASGAFMKRGATPATDNGELVVAGGASATPDIIGILSELHDFSVSGDNLIAGTAFVTRAVDLINPGRIVRIQYDPTSTITCTQAVNTTTMTVTSLEDNIDACFLVTIAGTGLGQSNYAPASASGSVTLKAAFGTDLDTTSTFIKILPRFHPLASFNSAGTQLASQAAAGAVTVMTIDTWIERNGHMQQMDPTKHDALTGLNGLASARYWADLYIRDTIPYSID